MSFERKIEFAPAYDKRSSEPNKNYGVHGVEMRFYLKGEDGVVQFLLYTNWHTKKVQEEFDSRPVRPYMHLSCHPMAADIGYHSPRPIYEGQTMLSENCHILNGPCYYDGSSLNAEAFYWTLVEEGEEALWKKMEEWYEGIFKKEAIA